MVKSFLYCGKRRKLAIIEIKFWKILPFSYFIIPFMCMKFLASRPVGAVLVYILKLTKIAFNGKVKSMDNKENNLELGNCHPTEDFANNDLYTK